MMMLFTANRNVFYRRIQIRSKCGGRKILLYISSTSTRKTFTHWVDHVSKSNRLVYSTLDRRDIGGIK